MFTEQRGQTNLKIICVEHVRIFLLSPAKVNMSIMTTIHCGGLRMLQCSGMTEAEVNVLKKTIAMNNITKSFLCLMQTRRIFCVKCFYLYRRKVEFRNRSNCKVN